MISISQNRIARVITLCALYFAQGMPYGFVTYLLAPFMAGRNFSTDTVGKLTFCATLPWSIKFIWGPVIDRFTYRAMGRRRPWIIFAQLCMMTMFLLMVSIPDLTADVKLLFALVFITNVFASMQDVSVDALAVEILEEKERGLVNGLMFGCSSGGAAFVSIVLMKVMKSHGMKEVLIIQALLVMLILMLPLMLRERDGEKLLPWLKGKAMGVEQQISVGSGKELIYLIVKAFSLRSALVMLLVAVFVKIAIELHGVVATTYYIQQLGWDYADFGSMRGRVELFALTGCFGGGFLADRLGHKKVAMASTVIFGTAYILFAVNPPLWENRRMVEVFFMTEGIIYGALSVSLFAMCMDISLPVVAGTQFTAYMAMTNLSASTGKLLAGWFDYRMGYGQTLIFWGIFQAVVISVLLLFIDPHERKKKDSFEAIQA